MKDGIDVLMITHNRAAYTARSLPRLLDTASTDTRIWLWHNGDDAETLDVVRAHLDHPRVHEFHHSPVNERLRVPTNWFWDRTRGSLVGKVDDDCLVSPGWIDALRDAHTNDPSAGVVCCWHFPPSDFDEQLAQRKLRTAAGVTLLENFWVAGSGYLMKRLCVEDAGILEASESWTDYCIRLALRGWRNGWLYPLVLQDHMDDPRSPNSGLRSDADLIANRPLSARSLSVDHLSDWENALRRSARLVQTASIDPGDYRGVRLFATRVRRRVGAFFGGELRRPT
jgi:hypothetical protein